MLSTSAYCKVEFVIEENFHKQVIDAVLNIEQNFNYFLCFNKYTATNKKINVGVHKNATLSISNKFVGLLQNNDFDHNSWFAEKPLLIENNKPDYLATCFYMINCLQEYAPNVEDKLNRFDYEKSYQKKYNCPQYNLVLDYFQEMAVIIFGEKIPLQQSEHLLSHDIDFVYSAWKDETKNAFKKLNLATLFSIAQRKFKGKDNWQNVQQILLQEQENNIASTFFFLTEEGKTNFEKVLNADYKITDRYLQNCLEQIQKSKQHEIGLHKSISSKTINAELENLPTKKLRYHYLKFNVKEDYEKIENSKITEDFSLGFSTQIGFRNSYGLPFKPYNPLLQKQYSFTVYPIHIMDSSLYYFMQITKLSKMIDTAIGFLQKHQKSCVLSVLWHNNFYEKESYQKLLDYIQSSEFF